MADRPVASCRHGCACVCVCLMCGCACVCVRACECLGTAADHQAVGSKRRGWVDLHVDELQNLALAVEDLEYARMMFCDPAQYWKYEYSTLR